MKHVYLLQYQLVIAGKPTAFQMHAETGFGTLAEFVQAICADAAVMVERLDTVPDGRGGLMVRGRREQAIGGAGLVSIRHPERPIWEPEA